MKIAILGYGKMGKTIEKIALQRGHEIVLKTNSKNPVDVELLKTANVAIEFSRPDTAVQNIHTCFDNRIPVVVGTTGWQEEKDDIYNRCLDEGQSIFYASNFSIGINIFNEVSKYLTRLIGHYPEYKTNIDEIHHIHKLDKPSGTAILLADGIIDNHPHLDEWVLDKEEERKFSIYSHREGDVPGTHTITHESEIDKISFTHEAKGREGFAQGAVLAAEFLPGKIGNYSMKDLIKLPQ